MPLVSMSKAAGGDIAMLLVRSQCEGRGNVAVMGQGLSARISISTKWCLGTIMLKL
jgi:hypothetical protein